MFSSILPHTYVVLRLPSGLHKVLKLIPDTTISLGKYGSFNTNSLLGRPYHLTFEILDKVVDQDFAQLRVVPAVELHAEALSETEPSPSESRDDTVIDARDGEQYDVVAEDGEIFMRNNRLTLDDSARQALSMEEIEELKKATISGSGKEIIAKLLQSHSALDEKTAFSLAKYTLRKTKKYMRRFSVLPMDVSLLAEWMLREKEPARIMELREEMIGFMNAWSNAHCGGDAKYMAAAEGVSAIPHHRWLAVDDTSGLVVAALAERMGILYPEIKDCDDQNESTMLENNEDIDGGILSVKDMEDTVVVADPEQSKSPVASKNDTRPHRRHRRYPPDAMSATSNTITLLHPATQPNLSILTYFSYDPNESGTSNGPVQASDHPLHTHLKTLSWLQLLAPHLDTACIEPPSIPDATIGTWKPGKRGAYYRKRRRWERVTKVVEETRAGGFDGLVIASTTASDTVLHNTVPLLRGGAQVVVYSPSVEPLAELMDMYSSARKTAFMAALSDHDADSDTPLVPSSDFPVDPRLLLGASVQTVRAREWQVLPGRTHPLMTSRGGPEGYVFTATRVLPVEGKVEARGRYVKRRKVDDGSLSAAKAASSEGMVM